MAENIEMMSEENMEAVRTDRDVMEHTAKAQDFAKQFKEAPAEKLNELKQEMIDATNKMMDAVLNKFKELNLVGEEVNSIEDPKFQEQYVNYTTSKCIFSFSEFTGENLADTLLKLSDKELIENKLDEIKETVDKQAEKIKEMDPKRDTNRILKRMWLFLKIVLLGAAAFEIVSIFKEIAKEESGCYKIDEEANTKHKTVIPHKDCNCNVQTCTKTVKYEWKSYSWNEVFAHFVKDTADIAGDVAKASAGILTGFAAFLKNPWLIVGVVGGIIFMFIIYYFITRKSTSPEGSVTMPRSSSESPSISSRLPSEISSLPSKSSGIGRKWIILGVIVLLVGIGLLIYFLAFDKSDDSKKPADSDDKSDDSKKPSDSKKKPSDPKNKPSKKPSDSKKKPSDSKKKPSDPKKKPSDPKKKPSDPKKPAAKKVKPSSSTKESFSLVNISQSEWNSPFY